MPSEASEVDFFLGSALLIYAFTRVQESPLLFDCVKLYLMNQVVVMLGTFHHLTVVVI